MPGQIHQLFQNLVSNAIKFNENGTPTITIEQKEISEELVNRLGINPEKYVCIIVKDNGIGFDQEYSEKIFGIFQRLNGSNYQGTGIGLAISKKIIDNHQGYIIPQSEAGKGATFNIILPK